MVGLRTALGVLVLWGMTFSAASAAISTGEGWPQWLGPNHDGKSTDAGLLKQWPENGPRLLWTFNGLGHGYGTPAVADGVVYVTGDNNARFAVFGITDGKQTLKIDDGPVFSGDHPGARGTPTVDHGKLYILSGTGVLGCYDVKSGKREWYHEMKEYGGSPGGWGYAESPLVVGDMVIVKAGGKNCIVALNKRTGRGIWASTGFTAGPEYGSCIPVEYGKSKLIVTGTHEGLIAVHATDGSLAWGDKFSAGNVANCPTPAFSDGYVFWANGYGRGGVCMKLNEDGTAAEAWTTHDMDCHHGGYIIDNGYIYGNDRDGWTCLELKSGQQKWHEKGVGKGSICYADGMLYLFAENGGECAIAPCTPDGLKITGRVHVAGNGPSWAHPVVTGGKLYLRYDSNLYCFDVKGS